MGVGYREVMDRAVPLALNLEEKTIGIALRRAWPRRICLLISASSIVRTRCLIVMSVQTVCHQMLVHSDHCDMNKAE